LKDKPFTPKRVVSSQNSFLLHSAKPTQLLFTMANCLQCCVRLDRPGIWTLDLPFTSTR